MRNLRTSGLPWVALHPFYNSFKLMIEQRARAYLISQEPLETPLSGRDEFGCNCYSSGETTYVERIMPMAHKKMLGYVFRQTLRLCLIPM